MRRNVARPGWIRAYRVGFALLAFAAIGYQLVVSSGRPSFRPDNFFSFFTIQSNILAAVVLLWDGLRPPGASRTRALLRGAAVLYMSITFVVFALLLSDLQEQLQLTIPWVDTVLHRIMPIVLMLDWLLDPPPVAIAPREAALWLIYPLLYALYTLIRGPFVSWYPYPFLNPATVGGYGVVLLYCVAITIAAAILAVLVALVGRQRWFAALTGPVGAQGR